METQYEATVRLLGGNFLSEEPADADEASRWSTIGKEYACVQDGSGGYEKILNRAEKASKIKG